MVNLWGSIIRYASLMSVLSTNNGLNTLLPAAGEPTKKIVDIHFVFKVLLEMEIWSLMVKWFGFYFCHFNNGFPEALATM